MHLTTQQRRLLDEERSVIHLLHSARWRPCAAANNTLLHFQLYKSCIFFSLPFYLPESSVLSAQVPSLEKTLLFASDALLYSGWCET